MRRSRPRRIVPLPLRKRARKPYGGGSRDGQRRSGAARFWPSGVPRCEHTPAAHSRSPSLSARRAMGFCWATVGGRRFPSSHGLGVIGEPPRAGLGRCLTATSGAHLIGIAATDRPPCRPALETWPPLPDGRWRRSRRTTWRACPAPYTSPRPCESVGPPSAG